MATAVEATLQEVHDHFVADALPAEAERARRTRRAIIRLGEVAGRPLSAIPAARAAIRDLCGPAVECEIVDRYESPFELHEDRRLIYAACEAVTHERAARRERDCARDLWSPVIERSGNAIVSGDDEQRRLETIGLRELIDRARRQGLPPAQLTPAWVATTVRAEKSKRQRRALQCGARILKRLGFAAPDHFRASTPGLTPALAAHHAFFREEARLGRLVSEHSSEREGGVGARRLSAYDTAVRYFARVAVAAGIYDADDDPPLSFLSQPRTIWRVLEHQIKQQKGEEALSRETAAGYFGAILIILGAINPALAAERKKLMRVIKQKFAVGKRSISKEAVAHRLLDEIDFEEKLASLPWELRAEAERILAQADGRALTRAEHFAAMQAGGVATLLYLGFLVTTRVSETLSLSRRGPAPSLRVARGSVKIRIAAEDMKNNKAFKADISDADGELLSEFLIWYEQFIRPLILRYSWGAESSLRAHKVFPIDPKRAHAWFHRMTRHEFCRMNPHLLRTLVVTLLLKDGAMTFEDAAALLGVTVATVKKYYAFVDQALRAARARAVVSGRLHAARQGRSA